MITLIGGLVVAAVFAIGIYAVITRLTLKQPEPETTKESEPE